MKKNNLKHAVGTNQIDKFIKQNKDKVGNKDQFDKTFDSILKKKKSTRQTSLKDSSEI